MTRPQRVRFAFIDVSLESFVVTCPRCPHWSAVRLSLSAAHGARADHDIAVHGVDERSARDSAEKYSRRHASKA